MHTLAVTNKGLVFAWGDNTKGQLGLGSSDTASHKHPRCVVNHFFFVHLLVVFQDPCFLLNLSKAIKIFGVGGECVELGLRGMLWNPWYTFERISPALP